jgi:adenosylcobinamide-GDP ribazoletransferase
VGFFTAIKFLTIFPLPWCWDRFTQDYGKALPYFPLVGVALGGILFGLSYGLSFILSYQVVAALLIIALVIMTGAHHLDGLMDSFDGISGKSRERRLEIMSDSHVGAFGVIAAFLLLLLKYASLTSLHVSVQMPALLLMCAVSRWIMVSALFIFPSAKTTGMGYYFKQGARWYRFAIATAITIVISLILLNWQGLVLLAVVSIITFGIASYFYFRLGGLTGDIYGALSELSEVLLLITVILFWRVL